MSEAEIPNNEPGLHQANQPAPALDSSADGTELINLSVKQPENPEIVDDIDRSTSAGEPEPIENRQSSSPITTTSEIAAPVGADLAIRLRRRRTGDVKSISARTK
jgi:hypothetical protein